DAAALGDLETAIEHLERALAVFETMPSPWPIQLARTLLALGAVQRRARRKQLARSTLERARALFDDLGARLWSERARAELAQSCGRPLRTGAWTAPERAAAERVAAGGTNAEVARELFLSRKTVEWNLSKIYRKLHVRSRAELAARLAKMPAASG